MLVALSDALDREGLLYKTWMIFQTFLAISNMYHLTKVGLGMASLSLVYNGRHRCSILTVPWRLGWYVITKISFGWGFFDPLRMLVC